MPKRTEKLLRNLIETPDVSRSKTGIKGMKIPMTLVLQAGEVLELGDLAAERGETTELLAARLLRVAFEALVGHPLGWPYDINPVSREARRAVAKVQRKVGSAPAEAGLPPEETPQAPEDSGGSQEEPPESGS